MSARKPLRNRLASSCSGPRTSRELSGCNAGSASSMNSHPPGRNAPTMASIAFARSGTWTSTRRAWTRSNPPAGEGSTRHIVGAHLDLRAHLVRSRTGPRHVDVGGEDMAPGSHPPRQPLHHRCSPGTDLPATPTRCDAELLHVGEGRRVEELDEGGEALCGGACGVREQVGALGHEVGVGAADEDGGATGVSLEGAGCSGSTAELGSNVGSRGCAGTRGGGGRCGRRSWEVPA